MSVVTTAILTCALADEDKLDEVNRFFSPRFGFRLVEGKEWGGGKVGQAVVALGAFNYLDEPALLVWLDAVRWEDPASVRLFYSREHDEDGVGRLWKPVAPASGKEVG